ncbi:MAG: GNAT family N-acetyltransferase [Bacillota bacterium]|nr:GNAT family N-acetyltransferase [Bacillota bacterium]
MDVTFRESDLSNHRDNEAIVSLLNEFMYGRKTEGENIIDTGLIEKLRRLGTAKVYLCEYLDSIIGIAVCFVGFSTFKQKELLNIHDFYIKEEYQGRELGRRFLEYIENQCFKNGFCRITLEVYNDNVRAMKLYEKAGFVGNKNNEPDFPVYAMKKELD